MQLLRARVANLGPFANLTFGFSDSDDRPRPITCVFGSAGVGKTSLVAGLASTRPGYAVAFASSHLRGSNVPWLLTEWTTGDDETARPHPLCIATPGLLLEHESEERATVRRREQAAYERRAAERGFAFVAIPGCRWFSRSPLVLSNPDRGLMRHEIRTATSFEDATRSDLARETKQVLSYAAIGAALENRTRSTPLGRLFKAVETAVGELVGLIGYRFVGADPATLEPMFEDPSGGRLPFADAPTAVRHLTAFAALPIRAMYAAYPDQDPLESQAVVVIDDVDLHQDAATKRAIACALRKALPHVQWILTTCSSSVALGCNSEEIIALRRTESRGMVEVYTGSLAVVH